MISAIVAKRAELFPSIELASEIEALKAQLAAVVGVHPRRRRSAAHSRSPDPFQRPQRPRPTQLPAGVLPSKFPPSLNPRTIPCAYHTSRREFFFIAYDFALQCSVSLTRYYNGRGNFQPVPCPETDRWSEASQSLHR